MPPFWPRLRAVARHVLGLRSRVVFWVPLRFPTRASANDLPQERSSLAGRWAVNLLLFTTLNWVILFGGVLGIVAPGNSAGHQGGHIAALLLALGALAARPWRWTHALPPPSLIAALLWCWLSLAWSIDPDSTVRKLTLTTAVIGTAFIATATLSYERLLRIFRGQLLLTLAFCYLLVAFFPDKGIQLRVDASQLSGNLMSWRGSLVDKNACGAFCAVTVLVFLFGSKDVPLWRRSLCLIAAFVFLVKTESKSAIGVLALAIACGSIIYFYRPYYRALMIPAVMILVVAGVLAWPTFVSPFRFAAVDQNPLAFTGRGLIWIALLRFIKDHSLLGGGYGAFWDTGQNGPIYRYSDLDWVQHMVVGHNGYLDMWSQVGVPGVILVVNALFVMPFLRMFASTHIGRDQLAMISSLIIFSAGDNLTESTLFDRDTFLNVTAILCLCMIGVIERRRAR